MASQEELDREKQKNKLLEEQNRLYERQLRAQSESISLSSSLVDSLKESMGIQSRRTQFDQNLLSLSKKINKTILDQEFATTKLSALERQRAKNQSIINSSKSLESSLSEKLTDNDRKRVDNINNRSKALTKQLAQLDNILGLDKESREAQSGAEKELRKKIAANEAYVNTSIEGLSISGQQLLFAKQNREELEKTNAERENEISNIKSIQSEIGLLGGAASGVEKALSKLGFPELGVAQAYEDTVQLGLEFKEQVKYQEMQAQSLGLTRDELVGITPELAKQKGLTESQFKAAQTLGKEVAQTGNNFGAAGKFASILGGNLKGLLSTANLMSIAIGLFVKALASTDKAAGDLAKNLGISYDQSLDMVSSMTDIANLSMDTFVTTEGLVKAQTQLSTALGTNAQLSSTLLVDFTKLTEQAGYSAEAATTLGKVSLATGQTAKGITSEFLGQAKALNLSNNLALNEKQLLESVAKTSKGTLATFAAKPKELSKAIFAAKKLGLEISQVEKIADGLLDIEQSLTAEFEAEVITGKQLNLERARFFALNNDIAGVAEELGKQGVTQASFAKSSRIEQEAVAAAMGMSRDELGQMLIEQQALSAVGAKDTEEAKAKFEALRAQYGEAEAIKRLGDETYARQLASQSAQERFNKVVSKLQDIFVSLAEPVLAIVSPFMDLITTVMPALNVAIIPIKAILEGIGFVISGLVKGIGFIGEGFSNIGKMLVGVLSPVFNSISESISAFIEPVVNVLSPVIDKISNVFNGIKNTISSIVDYTKQFAELTSMVVAGMAAGAVIQKRQLILDGLRVVKLGVINTIQNKGLLKSIAGMATKAFEALGPIPIIGPVLGAAAAASAYMLGKSYMDKAGDVMSPADGKTVISTKEGGLFELSKNDDVAAAPGLLDNLKGNGIDKKISTPTPQESKPLEIRGLDKLLSAFSIQPSKQLELNQASSPIQPLGREIEPSLPTTAPLPERGLERNIPTATTVAIDYDKLANAIAMGAERGTAKAKLNVNLDGNAVANNLQTPMAMGARRYSV